jgi:hypothetical protein
MVYYFQAAAEMVNLVKNLDTLISHVFTYVYG